MSLSMERPAIKALALPVPSDFNGQGIPVPFAGLGRPRWWLGETVVFLSFFWGEITMKKKGGYKLKGEVLLFGFFFSDDLGRRKLPAFGDVRHFWDVQDVCTGYIAFQASTVVLKESCSSVGW